MNPQDVSGFITNLLKSGPEILGSFLTGAVLTIIVVLALRHVFFPHGNGDDTQRLETEIIRKDAEINRKDGDIIRLHESVANLDKKWTEANALVSKLQREIFEAAAGEKKFPPPEYQQIVVRCAQLEDLNQSLRREMGSLDQKNKNLQVELEHLADWFNRVDEENVRLTEGSSLSEG